MIGTTYKKFAAENGLVVSHGVAYGDFRGYAATLSEGMGWKMMAVSTKFFDPAQIDELEKEFDGIDLMKEYRVQKMDLMADGIVIIFNDNPGTMKKIRAFIDFFFPLLDKYGATGVNVCPECGEELLGAGSWKLVNGVAMHLHEGCAQHISREAETHAQMIQESDSTSYGKGILGALVGSVIGAIPWAIVQYIGYIAAIMGLLIGFLSKKFYELFHGKNGKGKVLIIAVCAILGVIIGNVAADVIDLIICISDGTFSWMKFSDIPSFIAYVYVTDPEYRSSVIRNIVLGIIFALLGMFDVLRGTRKESAGFNMVDLK